MIDRVLAARSYVLGLFAVVLAFAAYGVSYLAIDPNNRVFFSKDHQHYSNLLELEDRFGSNTNLLFLIVGDEPIAKSDSLANAVIWLSSEIWRIDQVTGVDSAATYPHVSGTQEELVVQDVLEFVCPGGSKCDLSRMSALDQPYLVGRIVGKDARSFAVVADVDLTDPTPDEVSKIAAEANQLKTEFNDRFPELSVYLTGGVPMMQAFFDAARRDTETLIALAMVILTLGLFFFLGGFLPTLFMVLLGVSSVVITVGVAGWMGYVINTATATVPLIVLTLVIASAMHVFLHIVREEGMNSREGVRTAVRTSVAANWKPVTLTAATTAVGLLSMVFVSAPPLRELGVLAAAGVLIGALLSLTVVPCLFTYLPSLRVSNWLAGLQRIMNRYARWIESARPNMIGVGAIFVLALIGLAKVTIDEDFVRYFTLDSEFRRDTESITDYLTSPYHVDVVYDSEQSAGVYSEEAIGDLEDLVAFLREDPRVVNVASILDVLREVGATMTGSQELTDRSPDELAQFFLSYELSLNRGQSTTDLLDLDHRRTRVSVLLSDMSMAEIRQLVETIEAWANERKISDRLMVSGEGVPTAYLSSESIREMGAGIVTSVFVSTLLIGLYFRDMRACLAIFVATVVPILAGFGAWGWIESEIGMAATLVVAITIGVVIDDTIHLTYRYLDGFRNLDLTSWGATAYSVHKTGTAIVVTSLVLVAGLLVLMGSEFRMNSTFGVCSSLIIAFALLYNLTIAPHFLRRLT